MYAKEHNEITISEMKTKGMSSLDEIQKNYWEKRHFPFTVGIELTSMCNLRCIHCYLSESLSKRPVLNTEQIIKIIDKLHDFGVLVLYFTGGEIFTRPDFKEIYIHAKKKGFLVELLTNSTLMTDEILETLDKYPPAIVSISLYGASPETYKKVTGNKNAYHLALNSIKRLTEKNIDIEIKFIGLKENIQDYDAIKKLTEELNVPFKMNLEIFPTLQGNTNVISKGLSPKEIVEFEKIHIEMAKKWYNNIRYDNPYFQLHENEYPQFSCNVASTLCFIDNEGYVNPCHKMRLKEFNILSNDLEYIWKNFQKYRKMKAPKNYKCAKCKYIHFCSPCPVVNYLENKDYAIPATFPCKLTGLREKEFSNSIYSE